MAGGSSWAAATVNKVGESTRRDNPTGYRHNTASLILWDDWAGWYDHEPPAFLAPPEGGTSYEYRVPFLFVSAYTPKGTVNNFRHDFGSILRFIEPRHQLGFAIR